jgi:hypothetical protein
VAVFRVTDPGAFAHPEIQAFIYRALAANKLPPTTIGELHARVGDPNLGIFIGMEGGKLGMTVAQLPTSHFMLAPQVLLAYNEGPHALASAVIAEVKAWIAPTGWRKLIGCNRSGHPDRAWCRVFKQAGTPSPIGTAYEFEWE